MKDVRPTTGKTLQALFNILGPLRGKAFLDLFAGTGRVAAEARSRGARVVTVELLRDRYQAIRKDLGERDHLALCMDVRRALAWLEKRQYRFDVIFADPPYQLQWMALLPSLLARHRALLAPGGRVVLEHSHREAPDLGGTIWNLEDQRSYGISALAFLGLRSQEELLEPREEVES